MLRNFLTLASYLSTVLFQHEREETKDYYKQVVERVTMNGKSVDECSMGGEEEEEKSKAAAVGRKGGRGGR